LADPGAVTAAQVGIAVTNRRTTSALMKPTLPLFDTTRRPYRRDPISCTVLPFLVRDPKTTPTHAN
jgi:hypothetical protein